MQTKVNTQTCILVKTKKLVFFSPLLLLFQKDHPSGILLEYKIHIFFFHIAEVEENANNLVSGF